MDAIDLSAIYTFLYNLGEALTMTWTGRAALFVAVASLIKRAARA